jgi:hypothetical protein
MTTRSRLPGELPRAAAMLESAKNALRVFEGDDRLTESDRAMIRPHLQRRIANAEDFLAWMAGKPKRPCPTATPAELEHAVAITRAAYEQSMVELGRWRKLH